MSIVRLLPPPYRQIGWLTDTVPPLGAIVLCGATSAEAITGTLRPLLRRAPWCAPCLITGAETATPRVLVAIHELPGQPAFVPGPLSDEALRVETLTAIRARPIPGGARLADFVVRRTGRPDIRLELATLLGVEAVEPVASLLPERTLRDRLRRFGTFGSHCWRAIGALCRGASKQDRRSVDRLAVSVGVGPRTLRTWVRRYLGVTMSEFRSRVGWEWVL